VKRNRDPRDLVTEHAKIKVGDRLSWLQNTAKHLGQVVGRDTRAEEAVETEREGRDDAAEKLR
jgi:hypothetical protein